MLLFLGTVYVLWLLASIFDALRSICDFSGAYIMITLITLATTVLVLVAPFVRAFDNVPGNTRRG